MRGGRKPRFDHAASPVVLVDEPAEQVPPANISRAHRHRVPGFCERWGESEGAMGPRPVVVLGIGPECSIEMPPTEDECPVEALRPDRRDDPFSVGIGVRGPDRRQDHPRPFRANDFVERSAELRVSVADEEPDGGRSIIEFHREVPGLLADPRRVWVGSGGTQVDPPAPKLDEHEDIERPEPSRLDGEEVARDDPIRLSPEELRPARSGPPRGGTRVAQSGAGFSRASRRMSSRISASIEGRPGRPVPPYVHFRFTSWRCHRRRVAGVARKATQRSRGIARLAAASRTRSMIRSLGGPLVRCSTRS